MVRIPAVSDRKLSAATIKTTNNAMPAPKK